MRGERKKFAIQARKVVRKKNTKLSNTVAVRLDDRAYTCYIGFDDSLVEFVGGKLPRGLTEFDPAYLEVTHLQGKWVVAARYVRDATAAVLWRTAEKPAWLPDDNGEA